jgi:CheY-like chemotaxis protein/anti-sigma regulatory factor (Ser/Thr protein kinase)
MEAALDKGIDLKVTKSGSVPDAVVLDSKRVTQVLTNLVGNSIKFTESGRVEVQVETDTRDGYELLLFKVIDTGIGIPEDKLENIFDSFYQAENYLSKEHDGTGLGLAISKRLAELMDGRLSAESVKGAGSTFTFSLPLQRSDKPAREPKNEAGDLSSLTGLKVLVVEDNKVNRLFLSEMLEKNGMKVVNAEDGAEAVDAVKNEHFDLVLMDIQMPRMDGVEAAQKIRRIKGGNSLKIIALTAYAMQGDRDKFLESGMDEYVAKPVDIGELNSVIKKVTAGKE